jgi:hypothetical protein
LQHILSHMEEEGFWVKAGPGYNPKYKSTVWALILLAQLGASVSEDSASSWHAGICSITPWPKADRSR